MQKMRYQWMNRIGTGICILALLFVVANLKNEASANNRVAISINNGVVTSYQLRHRMRFLNVTGFKGDERQQAIKELTEEELIFQEARRVSLSVPDSSVERAFGTIAQRLNLNGKQFEQGLRQRGVDPNTLKSRLRSQILWRDIVLGRSRATQRETNERDITSILFNRGSEDKNRKIKEVILEQYTFVLKRGSSDGLVQQRIQQAETFRRKHSSCSTASEDAIKLDDVVVKKLGRFTEDTLPPNFKEAVLNTPIGGFTKPERGELGIGFLAVCEERVVVDNSASNLNVGQLDTQELQQSSEKWLRELRERADIRIR